MNVQERFAGCDFIGGIKDSGDALLKPEMSVTRLVAFTSIKSVQAVGFRPGELWISKLFPAWP